MFGFQNYPTPAETNQLNRINSIKETLSKKFKNNITYGFADHVHSNSMLRYMIPATAVGAGFLYIEKHITLKTKKKLEDAETALYPKDFKIFCDSLRKSFLSLGAPLKDNFFGMSKEELNYRNAVRRHVLTAKILKKGTIIKYEDLALKRASENNGIKDIKLVIGKKLNKTINANQVLKKQYFE